MCGKLFMGVVDDIWTDWQVSINLQIQKRFLQKHFFVCLHPKIYFLSIFWVTVIPSDVSFSFNISMITSNNIISLGPPWSVTHDFITGTVRGFNHDCSHYLQTNCMEKVCFRFWKTLWYIRWSLIRFNWFQWVRLFHNKFKCCAWRWSWSTGRAAVIYTGVITGFDDLEEQLWLVFLQMLRLVEVFLSCNKQGGKSQPLEFAAVLELQLFSNCRYGRNVAWGMEFSNFIVVSFGQSW